MAYDKVVDSAVLDAGLKATANAIRGKTGDSALIEWKNADGFKDAVDAIPAGGGGGESGYDFSELPTPFTNAISGSFILDADAKWNYHTISVPNSINLSTDKPVMVLIYSDDTETVYSSTVKTAQVLFGYDEAPRKAESYKLKVGFYAYTETTGSYSSSVYGSLSKSGSTLVDYGYKSNSAIKVSVNIHTSEIELQAGLNVPTAYYLAGKKYYWLLLGCEV